MTRDRDKQLLSIANASGFPFQLSVVRRVEPVLAKGGWRVLVPEHPWTDLDTGTVNFIDLVSRAWQHSLGCRMQASQAVSVGLPL